MIIVMALPSVLVDIYYTAGSQGNRLFPSVGRDQKNQDNVAYLGIPKYLPVLSLTLKVSKLNAKL